MQLKLVFFTNNDINNNRYFPIFNGKFIIVLIALQISSLCLTIFTCTPFLYTARKVLNLLQSIQSFPLTEHLRALSQNLLVFHNENMHPTNKSNKSISRTSTASVHLSHRSTNNVMLLYCLDKYLKNLVFFPISAHPKMKE